LKWIAASIALLAVAGVASAVIVTKEHKTCHWVSRPNGFYGTQRYQICN
jgi:hypothetical protein